MGIAFPDSDFPIPSSMFFPILILSLLTLLVASESCDPSSGS
jgi:hypothetical protein